MNQNSLSLPSIRPHQEQTGSWTNYRVRCHREGRLAKVPSSFICETKGDRVSFAVVGITLLRILKEPSLTIPWKTHNLLQQNIPTHLQTPAEMASLYLFMRTSQSHRGEKKKEWFKGQSEEGAKKQKPSEKLYMTGNSRRKAPSNRMNEKKKDDSWNQAVSPWRADYQR